MEENLDIRGTRGRKSLWQRIVDVSLTDVSVLVKGIDEAAIERLEQILLEADFGVDATLHLVDALEEAARRGTVRTEAELKRLLAGRIRDILESSGRHAEPAAETRPFVTLIVGVNGTGKTTTVAKLAGRAQAAGARVMLAATDTFRSAAQEQLRIWAERLGTDFVGGQEGGDPAAVAYDAAQAALARDVDHLLVDTAGRLHTRAGLMAELAKIARVLERLVPGAPHECLLVVDATSGQNVIAQAREFGTGIPLSGIVLAKFDSSARGGTAVAVARELGVPVRYLGTGETAGDLEVFDMDRYVERLLA